MSTILRDGHAAPPWLPPHNRTLSGAVDRGAQRFLAGGRSVQTPSYTSAAMPIDSPSVGWG